MSGIKGLVLLTRFDYIEHTYGRGKLKEFVDKIKLADKYQLIQQIVISKDYPEFILKAVDGLMLKEFFKDDVSQFLKLGNWDAGHLMPRYFQLYIDENAPAAFLQQMAKMRHILIGLGEMHIVEMEKNSLLIRINYGQAYLESVRLSELSFLEEGCRLCGAKNVQSKEENSNDVSVEYQISWEI